MEFAVKVENNPFGSKVTYSNGEVRVWGSNGTTKRTRDIEKEEKKIDRYIKTHTDLPEYYVLKETGGWDDDQYEYVNVDVAVHDGEKYLSTIYLEVMYRQMRAYEIELIDRKERPYDQISGVKTVEDLEKCCSVRKEFLREKLGSEFEDWCKNQELELLKEYLKYEQSKIDEAIKELKADIASTTTKIEKLSLEGNISESTRRCYDNSTSWLAHCQLELKNTEDTKNGIVKRLKELGEEK